MPPWLDWNLLLPTLGQLAIAYALSLPIAWEREQQERSAGLRTFPLVALACCGYMLLSLRLFSDSSEAQARVAEGLITGIGFIGGGAILKTRASVQGTATAASIWNTGAIGMAVAYGRYEIAIALSAANFLTLRLLTPLKPHRDDDEP
jgi:putative Mg2+ transporter-C (MgtC) family protein